MLLTTTCCARQARSFRQIWGEIQRSRRFVIFANELIACSSLLLQTIFIVITRSVIHNDLPPPRFSVFIASRQQIEHISEKFNFSLTTFHLRDHYSINENCHNSKYIDFLDCITGNAEHIYK